MTNLLDQVWSYYRSADLYNLMKWMIFTLLQVKTFNMKNVLLPLESGSTAGG